MARQYWRPANLLNPVPAVIISCADENTPFNAMTAAWAGTICSDPVMVSVSIRKNRHSHHIIKETGEFVMNLTNEQLVRATDYVGIYSGAKVDKSNLPGQLHLTPEKSHVVSAPSIAESPLCLECKVKQIIELGTHDMFIAEVVSTTVDDSLLDENGRLDLQRAHLIAYVHGEYYRLGKKIGKFGFTSLKSEKKENLRERSSTKYQDAKGKKKKRQHKSK